jgi:hypothetical protein
MIIIIGSNGQLGWELVRQSRLKGLETHALDCPGIDIGDPFLGSFVPGAVACQDNRQRGGLHGG